MALSKERVVDIVEVLSDGTLQVRYKDQIIEDGVVITSTYHRESIFVLDDISNKDQRIQDIAAVVRTPEAIAAAQNLVAELSQ